jgi:hypothetical protein
MSDEKEGQAEWVNSLINLIKIGQLKNFLDQEGCFNAFLTSDIEKLSISIKIEPTNIISFPKVK